MMPLTLTPLEQRLKDCLDKPMSLGILDGEHECQAMLAAVNAERANLGKPPVTIEAVRQAELAAIGSVDYPEQFAAAAADLVRWP